MKDERKRHVDIAITFMSGPLDGKIVTFEAPAIGQQRVLTIGRRSNSDIHLGHDNQVSRDHASIVCTSHAASGESGEGLYYLHFWLEDGGSRNGTYIEKETHPIVERVTLRPGTLFKVGKTWLRLDVPASF
jgi:pSer/pThr/pTyr-binding forkhead associated (FHA) protein